MRIPKTLTLEESVIADLERTKGKHSTSERVNSLLKYALAMERREKLQQEAAEFYSLANRGNRKQEKAFQKASRQSIAKD